MSRFRYEVGPPKLDRRMMLKLAAGALVAARTPLAAAAPSPTPGPRYFVFIFLSGGIDAIRTFDPKSRSEVEPWVDLPYASKDIVTSGNVTLAPDAAALAPLASRLAVVRGIEVSTAAHGPGAEHFDRMRTRGVAQMPTIYELLGKTRDTQAVGALLSRALFGHAHGSMTDTWFEALEKTSPAERELMARSLHERARELRTSEPAAAENIEQAGAFVERLGNMPTFDQSPWSKQRNAANIGRRFERLLWLLESDIPRCFAFDVGGATQPWDSHNFNEMRQSKHSGDFFPMLQRFLLELDNRSNRFGKLSDTTAVIVGSELGRFPRLNGYAGKDHFPEIPMLFYGRHFKTNAAYGHTDRRMGAQRVSFKTGQPSSSGQPITLDDVGTTLLHLSGVRDPSTLGYRGKILEFLV